MNARLYCDGCRTAELLQITASTNVSERYAFRQDRFAREARLPGMDCILWVEISPQSLPAKPRRWCNTPQTDREDRRVHGRAPGGEAANASENVCHPASAEQRPLSEPASAARRSCVV